MRHLIKTLSAKTIPLTLTLIFTVTLLAVDSIIVMALDQTEQRSNQSRAGTIILSSEESFMLRVINQERAKAGLTQLEIAPILTVIAREKSQDMVSYNYFGHLSERLGTVHDQLKRNDVDYCFAAENLAAGPDIIQVQQRLLSSPAHRSNILNPQFTRIGIGVSQGGPYGKMITQIFVD